MRDFIKRALTKLNKLTAEQVADLLVSAATEIDRLETALDSLTNGVLVCDTRHTLLLANKYAERYLQISHHDTEQGPIWTMIRNEQVRDFFESTLPGGDRVEAREFDLEIKGIQRLLSVSVLPLVRDRQVSGSLIHLEDITEKRGKEARLRRAENLASLTTLAAGVAHEIKNPLGSISIHIQLIQKAMAANREYYFHDHPEGDAQGYFDLLDKYTAVVNEEIDRLNHIVVDFLFAVRPMDMEFREGSVNALIEELIKFIRYELDEAKIACFLELDEKLPSIDFDERYLKQALLNLIKNAIAAMPGGGALTISSGFTDTDIQILIQDTGIGIPEEHLSKIFEPYFTTKSTGSGLGLTLVFKIIREHKGEVTVKSREGSGACFILTLPIPQRETRLIRAPDGASGEV
ncbi:MAG: PAS domain-containing sensor histidine kinase [Treponema sp.]|jgi:signal transduction histidine kinase|nr:PAS domain-containing sensor histidine kinase [Treponema sp.]